MQSISYKLSIAKIKIITNLIRKINAIDKRIIAKLVKIILDTAKLTQILRIGLRIGILMFRVFCSILSTINKSYLAE